jgi:acetyl-CoA acetyltransferase
LDLRNRYCIVGVGNTTYGKNPGVSALAHNVRAIHAAIEDAGLTTDQVDGVLTKAPTSTFPMLWAPRVAEALSITPAVTGTLDQAGASNVGLVQYAISALELGQANYIVCSYGDNPATGRRDTYARPRGDAAFAGLFGAPSSYAMIARRHMHEYGTTSEQLANVAIAHRYHASMNDNAHFQDPITQEDYDHSRWVAEPFHLLDCCPVSDGGAAFIVTTEDRAKDLAKRPVYIEGIGQGHPAWDFYRRGELASSGWRLLRGPADPRRRRTAVQHLGRAALGDRDARHAARRRGRPPAARRGRRAPGRRRGDRPRQPAGRHHDDARHHDSVQRGMKMANGG